MWGLIGAGLGLLGGRAQHQRAQEIEDQDRQLAAETARYSPWTDMKPGQIRRSPTSAFGSLLQGGVGGAMAGSSLGDVFSGSGSGPSSQSPMTGENLLGGQDMAHKIGEQYSMMGQEDNPWGNLNLKRPSYFSR